MLVPAWLLLAAGALVIGAARKVSEGSRPDPREVWVYFISGEWGRVQSVLIYHRVTSTATVELYREHRR